MICVVERKKFAIEKIAGRVLQEIQSLAQILTKLPKLPKLRECVNIKLNHNLEKRLHVFMKANKPTQKILDLIIIAKAIESRRI